MKQDARLQKNKRAIEYALHDHLDLLVDHPAKINAVLGELMLLLSGFYLC